MKENDCNADLVRGLRSQGFFAYKIPDLAQAVVKPFDIVASFNGRFIAIEGKLTKVKLKDGTFPPELVVIDRYEKTFRPHQIPNLQMIERQGGVGFVAIYLAEDRPGSALKQAWLIPVHLFLSRPCWRFGDLVPDLIRYRLTRSAKGWMIPKVMADIYGLPR